MRLIMFDMDGTLIDTHGLIAEHMASAFVEVGLPPPTPQEVRRIIGLSLPIAIGQLAGGADAGTVERMVEFYKAHYRASLLIAGDREPLFPGARVVLDRLREAPETQLGIATGKGLAGVDRILALHGLTHHFVTLQTPDHNPSKPHPGMLLRAMEETGVASGATVMIGDTVFDIELANAAGVAAIGVSWGYHDASELIAAGARMIIDRYDELEGALARVLE